MIIEGPNYQRSLGDAGGDRSSACSGIFSKFVACDEVNWQMYLDIVGLCLVHDFLDNLGALFIEQRLANLSIRSNCINILILLYLWG